MNPRTLGDASIAGWALCGAVVMAWLLLAGEPRAAMQPVPQVRLPLALETYLTKTVHLASSERKTLISGGPVTKLLDDVDASKEVAVFGAVWINASPSLYVERVKDIENFERGGAFRITKRISEPPKLEDFAQLELHDNDVADLKRCRVGDCEVKLGAQSLEKLKTEVDWEKPTAKSEAEAIFRSVAFEYVTGYREGGNARLAVYRDADRPTFVEKELGSMIGRLPSLASLPDLLKYLLEYPVASLQNATDFLYWQETQFGLKPTIRINHLVIQDRPEATVIASKMLYASHYFWTALELRVLMPDPSRGSGFWFVTVNRSRSDGLSGFIGRLIRGRVRNEVKEGTLAALTATKSSLEPTAR